ncbi:MAG: SRPBCC family protein [Nocardioides sp.]|nr:SRPBCC family protein [Nocardioides sp.]
MSTNTRTVAATPEQVWEVLCDGWLYPLWVVGATRMREVDDTWPAVGSRLHHSVGSWPVMLDDTTEVLEVRALTLLRLRARGWPLGAAEVVLRMTPHGAGTQIEMQEQAVSGPGALLPKPLQDPVLTWRNAEALQRLGYVVEHRSQGNV